MAGAKLFSTFYLSKSFYQVDYESESVGLTTFKANGKRYVFKKLVLGNLSSSSQFARMVDGLLKTIPLDQLAYFLDDLMVASMDVTTHLDLLELLLSKLASANLKLMPAQCKLLKTKVEFVGLTICEAGVSVNDQRVTAVKEIPASEHGYGAELAQWQEHELLTIAYLYKRVPNHKRKWSQHKLEFECLV